MKPVPDPTTAGSWQHQAERSNPFMVHLLATLALLCGRRFIRLLLYPIVFYFYLTGQAAKNASREALARFGGTTPGRREIFRHLYAFAMTAVDRIFLLANRTALFDIRLHGEEVFAPLRPAADGSSKGRGCILLVSHAGSFDVMRALGSREAGLPMKILMDKHHNKTVMALINSLDPALAEQVIDARQPPATLALELQRHLDNGCMIGIMADRSGPHEERVTVDFAGGTADFPTGPWLLSWVLKVPVIFCIGLYRGHNRYDLYFEHLYDALHGKRPQRHAIVQAAAAHYAARLEYYVRMAPYNWFNFYPFWHDETTTDH